MKSIALFLFSILSGILLISSQSVHAATFTIQMNNFVFNPSARSINVGDTIIWTNTTAATGHTTTSGNPCTANGIWGSPTLGGHATFTIIYTNFAPGTYPFFCSPHCSIGMTGTLTITNSVIAPPSVSITNPITGSQFAAPANITLMAMATQAGGTITNVQFFSGTTSLGNDTSSPYSATLNGAAAGSYNLTAVARNDQGGAATSAVVTVSVFAPSISLTNPLTGKQFAAPANISLIADASQTGGTITNVQFLSGSSPVGNATSAPFNFTVNGASAGNYNFSAIAMNNNGGAATSAVVNVFVLTNSVLSGSSFNAGQFQLTINGIAGQTYALETSSNLIDWSAISTNVAPGDIFNVVDPAATNGNLHFYRSRQNF